jgi:hypothetical protein
VTKTTMEALGHVYVYVYVNIGVPFVVVRL